MLILATVFQCLDPALTIAACLSSKPVFLSPMEKRDEATAYGCPPLIRARCKLMYHKERAHASQPRKVTFLLTFVRTTSACEYARKNRLVPCVPSVPMYVTRPPPSSSPRPQLIHFFFSLSLSRHTPNPCHQNYISVTTIRDISALRNDLLSALTSAGLVPAGSRTSPSSAELNAHADSP